MNIKLCEDFWKGGSSGVVSKFKEIFISDSEYGLTGQVGSGIA